MSVPKLGPLPGLRLPWQGAYVGPVFWTPAYLTAVSRHVDQVDLMAYDTGIPCYHYSNLAHQASAETVAAAVRGVRVALTVTGSRRRVIGVALFADYSSTPQDWDSYVSDWLRPGPVSREPR